MSVVFFVDAWSDVVCPFCYLGFRQFQDALDRFEFSGDVVVRHHAYELDPHASLTYPGNLNEMLANRYFVSVHRATTFNSRVEDTARQLGMRWSLDRARPTNTFDAHRLVALAATHSRQEEMLERPFRAYFSEGLLVSDHDTLTSLADEIGIASAGAMLSGHAFADEVRHDENLAAKIGIVGVPALILDGRVHLSGAQGAEAMLDALETTWGENVDLPA